jgi:hypothetical protein
MQGQLRSFGLGVRSGVVSGWILDDSKSLAFIGTSLLSDVEDALTFGSFTVSADTIILFLIHITLDLFVVAGHARFRRS